MIKVKYTYNQDKRECSLLVKGHAGQANIGEDIICASATILAYTIAQIVKAMDDNGELAEPPILELESGDATIVCRAKDDDLYAEMAQSFFTIKVGYLLLQHNYPQFVEIIDDKDDESLT